MRKKEEILAGLTETLRAFNKQAFSRPDSGKAEQVEVMIDIRDILLDVSNELESIDHRLLALEDELQAKKKEEYDNEND